jgi:Phage integrase, N-terminal SAM-like domain
VPMTKEDPQIETGEGLLAPFDLLEGTSESTRAKTAETFLELLGARVRNPNTRGAYRVAWRSLLAFCSARGLELESVKAYHVGAWLDRHPGSRSTQRQHLAAVRLLFDSLKLLARVSRVRGQAGCEQVMHLIAGVRGR